MIKILNTKSRKFNKQINYFLNKRKDNSVSKITKVNKIITDIEKNKDKSLIKYEKKFNNLKKLSKKNFFFTNSEIKNNIKVLDKKVKKSIDVAYNRILNFHKNQKLQGFKTQDKYNNTYI